jgi:hypothetical protein
VSDVIASDLELRRAVAKALGENDKSGLAFDERTTFTRRPAPFLSRHGIWLLHHLGRYHPFVLHLAYAPDGPARILSGRPETFLSVAREDAVRIETSDAAVAYGVAYLVSTAEPDELFYLVDDVRDLKFVPNATVVENAEIAASHQGYEGVVEPPAARDLNGHFVVTVYAARERALERHTLTVARDGDVRADVEVLAPRLPLVSSR